MLSGWLDNPWFAWGVGPYLASNLGFLVPALLLELVLRTGAVEGSAITYASANYQPRKQLVADTHKRIAYRWGEQVEGKGSGPPPPPVLWGVGLVLQQPRC
jgi:hypothetical protein